VKKEAPTAAVAATKPAKLSWKEQRELEALPDRIAGLEAEQAQVQARLNDPATYRDSSQEIPGLNARLQTLEAELEAAMLRWEVLESRGGK
jgi:ATP-binding cassette subfamily F protein uup